MDNDIFDWGQLPMDWWLQTALEIGADERHAKFAAAKFRNCSNTEAARLSGFGTGGAESQRSEGYRVARSNKVNQLLALASAQAGGGPDGSLTRSEARGILTAMARGSDPQIRIKAIELLSKMDREEQEAGPSDDAIDPKEEARLLSIEIPQMGVGAALALTAWARHFGHLMSFPYLREVLPVFVTNFPDDWKRLLEKHSPDERAFLDGFAAGPTLEGDALVLALTPPSVAKIESPTHAA
jgi:hypothetical protein